jgi:hypothetical protein
MAMNSAVLILYSIRSKCASKLSDVISIGGSGYLLDMSFGSEKEV